VPTSYPKCQPSEMMGLLVLLNSHKGSEDVALLADDLDLEIDEILPALEFAEILQLVKVSEGRATFTDLGKRLVAGSIRDRKTIIREQLRRTTLFRTLLRALESAADHSLTDDQLNQIASFTTATADEAVQTIVNWGRYAELFRYDADERRLVAVRHPPGAKSAASRPPPPGGSTSSTASEASGSRAPRGTSATTQTETRPAPVVPVTA
jgi:NitT/TauT family transport system ATP-binding protein